MDVTMEYGLAGRLPDVDPDVEAGRLVLRFEQLANVVDELPERDSLVTCAAEVRGHVPTRHDQRMARRESFLW